MPAEVHYACPDCGSIDLSIESSAVFPAKARRCECPNCSWCGELKDTVGFATTEQVWTTERIGEVLLRVSSKHAAGPLVQCLEFIGLLPKKKREPDHEISAEELAKHNELAQIIRDRVMRATFTALITTAFEEAEKCNKLYAIEMDKPMHPALEQSDTRAHEPGARVFGGDDDGQG